MPNAQLVSIRDASIARAQGRATDARLRRGPPPAPKPKRPRRGLYLRHAILSPYNLIWPGLVAFLAANVGGALVLIVGLLLQVVFISALPRARWFRAQVDERQAKKEREAAAQVRAQLLVRMSEEHQRELERLELLVDEINLRLGRGELAQAGNDCFGLGNLLAGFVRLAMAYKSGQQYFAATSRQALIDEIAQLEAQRVSAAPRVRRHTERRLEIARRRLARWDQTRDDIEAVVFQMATIRSLIHLAHESALAPVEEDDTTRDVEPLLHELGGERDPLRELAQITAAEDAVDPRVLELGRGVSARKL
jgi:hypothetical protein